MSEYANPQEVRDTIPDRFWKPTQPGEGISGTFKGYVKTDFFKEIKSQNDRGETVVTKRPVYQVELEVEGTLKQLPQQCTPPCLSQKAESGDAVVVVYEGEGVAKNASMNPPKLYKVTVSK